MQWDRKQTTFIFCSVLLLVVLISIVNLLLSVINFTFNLSEQCPHQLLESFIYFIGVLYINAFGCLWFRLVKYKSNCAHGFIHTLAFALMIYGHWHALEFLFKGKFAEGFNQYYLSYLCMFLFLIQYLLSFHFMVFRTGRTPSEVAFRTGMHTFGGVLMFFLCTFDAFLVSFKLSYFAHFFEPITVIFPLVPITCLIISVGLWFLILNPYFDWRRMSSLTRPRRSSTRGSQDKTARHGRRNRSKSPRRSTEDGSSCPPSRTSSHHTRS